jgi:hypothetical protein
MGGGIKSGLDEDGMVGAAGRLVIEPIVMIACHNRYQDKYSIRIIACPLGRLHYRALQKFKVRKFGLEGYNRPHETIRPNPCL